MQTISEALAIAINHQNNGEFQAAEQIYRQILQEYPNQVDAIHLLGLLAHQVGKDEIAVEYIKHAIAISGNHASFHINLGEAYRALRQFPEAVACFQRALELKPDSAEAYSNLGNALHDQEKLNEAVACYRRALELNPDYINAIYNLGTTYIDLRMLDDAVACFHRTLELDPENVDVHWNLANCQLLLGDFRRGWEEYEWRSKLKRSVTFRTQHPLWDGQPLHGKTILLHSEQGLGDTLQFVRYVPLVKARGGKVILECQKPLLPLLANFPADEVVEKGGELPDFDVHAPLLSLPRIFRTDLENIPAEIPYLFASPYLVERWREKLHGTDGFRIGIAWRGSPVYKSDRYRSTRLAHFAALAEIPGVRLISLQKGPGVDELSEVRNLFPILDFTEELDVASGPFMDTAAMLMNLDLVVTVDTALGHLAGGMGVPVWIALPVVPHRCWLMNRDDSPWYPTVRLFRQRSFGDWEGVFGEMRRAINEQRQV